MTLSAAHFEVEKRWFLESQSMAHCKLPQQNKDDLPKRTNVEEKTTDVAQSVLHPGLRSRL